jgi:hypothetical protein
MKVRPLILFDATLASSPLCSPPSDLQPTSTLSAESKSSLPSISTLQHVRKLRPFFSLLAERPACVALHPGSAALRVWLPFRRFLALKILGSLFQLPTLLGFSLRSFVPTGDRMPCFQGFFRSGAFLANLYGLLPALQRLYPSRPAVPLVAPEGLVRARAMASMGFSVS